MKSSSLLRSKQLLYKLRRASVEDQKLIVELFFALLFFRLVLFVCPFRHLRNVALFLADGLRQRDSHPEQRFVIARFCMRYIAFPPFSNCLVQALAFSFCLTRKSIEHQVHIGVRKTTDAAFSAHAWVTCNGEILIGGSTSQTMYQEILRIAPASR